VTATTTDPAKLGLLAQLGAEGVVMDGLNAVSVGEAVAKARPDAIVHQMTAISVAHAGKPDMKHMDRWGAPTNRLRMEGTDHLLAAAEATGVSRFVAQGNASWNGIRQGGWVKTEEDPLDPIDLPNARKGGEALRHLENVVVQAGGAVLRYGGLYGPGATDDQVKLVRKRQFPLVGRHRLLLVGASRRRGERYRPGRRAKGEGRVQHGRRRTRPSPRVAALSGSVRGREATDAGSPCGWPGCWPGKRR
jgi:nucleoside-diphosphate-sugar epimerase